jgi:hypothetical protein
MKYGMSGILQRVRLGQESKKKFNYSTPPPFHAHFSKFGKNCQIRGYPGGVR